MSDEKDPAVEPREQEEETPVVEAGLSNINIEEEMSHSYIDYSMSVIVGRALPDARDGLKPVHRRVLFTMDEMGNYSNRPYKKCARIVGDTMGKYHPHGDSAIYDTLVRLAQPFSMRYPLVDGQGNFGSVDGDPPAAMRYTESRMDKLAEEMLGDLDKNTVDFVPNYNGEFQEPTVLPAKLPNLLLNGSVGIAVGMATNIPPHNLGELCDGITHYIDNPKCSIDELMQFIKGPDFPTGGVICGTREIESMYKRGRGQLTVRGRAEVMFDKKLKKDIILITEIPYAVNKAEMLKRMAELINDKVIEGISDVRDESSEDDGIRIVIELKKGAFGEVVLNNLYHHTQLQTTFGAIMLALDQGRPKVMNLKELVRCYVDHRFEVVTRRTQFELDKALARQHILEGLLLALDHLDEVIRIIRDAANRDEAKRGLVERFQFSDRQVSAILEMRLYQLTGLERGKVQAEYDELGQRILELRAILADSGKIYAILKQDLADLKLQYVTNRKRETRRTDIVQLESEVNKEDLIPDAPCVITLSHRGYVKRVALSVYREQRRGGRGITGAATKEEDFLTTVFVAATHDTLLFFTNYGRLFAERAFEIPEASRTSFGKPIVNILRLQEGESVQALLPIRAFADDVDVFFATEKGTVKKTSLYDYRNVNKNGIRAINLEEGDRLIRVALAHPGEDILMLTANGRGMRFSSDDVRRMGRTATGVRGIKLLDDDVVRSFDIVKDDATLLIVTENGFGKRCAFADFSKHHRGGQGMIAIKDPSGRNGKVVAAYAVRDDQSMVTITSDGQMVRSPVSEIRVIGRAGQGVCLVRLAQDANVVSVSIADPEPVTSPEEGEAVRPSGSDAADAAPDDTPPSVADEPAEPKPESGEDAQ
ncbi:MAG: DNA gyrase subunit A [Kiritimatiellae bacterium]|nr:DNA gyrase subunit A [Kiritimatiellia bacterium]